MKPMGKLDDDDYSVCREPALHCSAPTSVTCFSCSRHSGLMATTTTESGFKYRRAEMKLTWTNGPIVVSTLLRGHRLVLV